MRAQSLPIDGIRPLIRIAHRYSGPLHIPERIIFDHELVLFLKGDGVARTREREYRFTAHHLFCIPPFAPHSFASNSCEHLAVHFDLAAGVPHFTENPQRRLPYRVTFSHGAALPFCRPLSPSDGIEAMLLDLLRSWKSRSPTSALAAQAALQLALAELLRVPSNERATDVGDARQRARIQRALAYVDIHYAEPVASGDIARAAGLSESRFSQVFRQWTGHSPKDYLRRVRIDKARALLTDIDLSIKEIARLTGFEDQYHFSRIFRQIDGLSPTLYRNAVLAGRK